MAIRQQGRQQLVDDIMLADDALGHLGAHHTGDLRGSVEQLEVPVDDRALFGDCHASPWDGQSTRSNRWTSGR
jgi:hypothetical protein